MEGITAHDFIRASDIPPAECFNRHIICVTGCMAAGKNAASDILSKHGYICTDADKLVHQILSDSAIQQQVLSLFAPIAQERGIVLTDSDGTLNRRALGSLLFSDKALLQKHEALIHPEVDKKIATFVAEHPNENIVLNATVLYKVKALKLCDTIIYITAPLLTRLRRAQKRDNASAKQILARFWQQRNLFAKYKKSNADIYRVSNTGNIRALEAKIDAILARLDS